MTANQVSKLTGLSISTLQYYEKIGLLPASTRSQEGLRQYDDSALLRLQEILLFNELGFSLKDIIAIVNNPVHDKFKALTQHIELLELKRTHLDRLIVLAKSILTKEADAADFSAFDTKELDEYTSQAKQFWKNAADNKPS